MSCVLCVGNRLRNLMHSPKKKYMRLLRVAGQSPHGLVKRNYALVQLMVTNIARKAKLKCIKVTAHTLRHTFATNYLKANLGSLVELAALMGHDSINTTAIYTNGLNSGVHYIFTRGSCGWAISLWKRLQLSLPKSRVGWQS